MMKNLRAKAWFGAFFLASVMGLLLFTVAGTIYDWQGWVYFARREEN